MKLEDLYAFDPDEEVTIINPSSDDFSLEVTNIHEKDEKITYTVKARESLKLPRYAADCVAERLSQRMASRKQGVITQAYLKQVLNQIRMYEVEEL